MSIKAALPTLQTTAPRINTPRAVRWFHALSDETRLEIVERLLDGERCVCELMDVLDVQQSRLSFHLKTLKEAGIVTDRREGRWVYYTLDRTAVEQIEHLVETLAHAASHPRVRVRCC